MLSASIPQVVGIAGLAGLAVSFLLLTHAETAAAILLRFILLTSLAAAVAFGLGFDLPMVIQP